MASVQGSNSNSNSSGFVSDADALNLAFSFGTATAVAKEANESIAIYENTDAEAAILKNNSNLKPGDVKVIEAGRYVITIMDKGDSPNGLHHNQPEVIIHDSSLLDNTPDTVIWGDPHFSIAGGVSKGFTFYNNLDLKLQNGTNVFIQTAQSTTANHHATFVSAVTISNSTNGVVIGGVDNSANGYGGGLTGGNTLAGPLPLPPTYDSSSSITQNKDGSWSFSNGVVISTLTTSLGYGINKGVLEWNFANL